MSGEEERGDMSGMMGAPVEAAAAAVSTEDVYKHYGSRRRPIHVLRGLNMTVPKGAIYGLLGPSGCGKTTLLRCIIGRLVHDGGAVVTLGRTPGTLGHGVPGRRVGYMPQELALYNEFTIGETLALFGRLHRMSSTAIKERTTFLLDFLHLPEKGRLISKLSGGQQRRTSFAIALLQEPELLILDEPTVGVDPLLRQRIWEHLLDIAHHSNCTIIITTHYVEEARQAHVVGLMRNGRLLAEQPPSQLLQQHNMDSLEEVFLKLCERDQVGDIEVNEEDTPDDSQPNLRKRSRGRQQGDRELLNDMDDIGSGSVAFEEKMSCKNRLCHYLPDCHNIFALCIKNFIILGRQIGFLLFEFFLPAIQIIMFCTCVGKPPYDLPMAVVNAETNGTCPGTITILEASCDYLTFLDNRTIIQNNFHSDLPGAIDSVHKGENWGVLEFRQNFTKDLMARMNTTAKLDNETIAGGEIHVYLDNTNQQIAYTLQSSILAAFQQYADFVQRVILPGQTVTTIPVKIEDPPIYGEVNPKFTDFMAAGIILSITFFMATGLTALSFVLERKQGLLDRTLVAGVSPIEVMISHMFTQFVVMMLQVGVLLFFTFVVFKIDIVGSFMLVFVLTLLQGLTGMALGFLISTLANEETSAIQLSLASVYPNMLLSGIIWPVEAMPVWLRQVSHALPMTYAAQAMRGIMGRGWGLEHVAIWRGYLVTIAWGWALMVISGIVLKLRKP